jgi:predicted acylesterase/phospholipase RssA
LAVSLLALSAPLLRCRVAEMAFAATIFKGDASRRTLEQLPEEPRYVFCATEMHTGQHTWFSRDLVYIRSVGLGLPRNLAVKSVVQMSANFPVAFPYRLISQSQYQFHLGEVSERPLFLVLSDGGVYDNMAVSWFKEGPACAATLQTRLPQIGQNQDNGEVVGRLRVQITAMEAAKPDALIVVNSSEPYTWRRAAQSVVPLWGEARTLVRINGTMYNQLGLTQKRSLRRQFLLEPGSGALVSIGEHPRHLVAWLYNSAASEYLRADLELPDEKVNSWRAKVLKLELPRKDPLPDEVALSTEIAELRRRAEEFPRISSERADLERQIHELEWQKHKLAQARDSRMLERGLHRLEESTEWRFWTKESEAVATTFRPLGKRTVATLLAHGYVSAMSNCHLLLDSPMIDSVPPLEDFDRLANGLPRRRRPQPLPEVGELV